MTSSALRRTTAVLALTAAALAGTLAGTVTAATAGPLDRLQSGGAGYGVYLVKDLGGGAYYNVTTGGLYAVSAGSTALVTAATTGAELLASSAANGRDLLLLVNGAVLVPVQQAL